MVFFCSNCWHEIDEHTSVCPHCGVEQQSLAHEDYIEKLIRALHHPEPSTPVRAAFLLGELRATPAIDALMKLAVESKDPYIQAAALEAIGKMQQRSLSDFLLRFTGKEQGVIVRNAANKAIGNLP